jgi:hypothetical protein
MDKDQSRDIVRAISELSRELKNINKSLSILAEDVKYKKIQRDNYLVKGMK